jgi:4-carboxymuconolactone decarboxylase
VPAAAGAETLPQRNVSQSAHPAARALGPTPRIAQLTSRDQVTEDGRAVFDAVAEGRGNVRGPFSLLMYSPVLCQRVLDLSNYLRFESLLSPRLRELATIAAAREKDCPYVWAAHAPTARQEGVPDATIQAIRTRVALTSTAAEDADIVEYTRQVMGAHRVEQPLFDRLVQAHGIPRLVEITALIGNYGFVAGLLNAVEVSPAPGAEALD